MGRNLIAQRKEVKSKETTLLCIHHRRALTIRNNENKTIGVLKSIRNNENKTIDFLKRIRNNENKNIGFLKSIRNNEIKTIGFFKNKNKKRSTVFTHRYADCLLKNTSAKHKKYVVNQKLEHVG